MQDGLIDAAVAERRHRRGDAAGHLRTARNCRLRAAGHDRGAEIRPGSHDSRGLATFGRKEQCRHDNPTPGQS